MIIRQGTMSSLSISGALPGLQGAHKDLQIYSAPADGEIDLQYHVSWGYVGVIILGVASFHHLPPYPS